MNSTRRQGELCVIDRQFTAMLPKVCLRETESWRAVHLASVP